MVELKVDQSKLLGKTRVTSPIKTRQPEGQPNLSLYGYAIAMNLVSLKNIFLNDKRFLISGPILEFLCHFGIKITHT